MKLFANWTEVEINKGKVGASLVAQLVKNPPVIQETLVQFLDWEDPMEKGHTTYSSTF